MQADKICVVQFLHPGAEHRVKDGLTDWNTTDYSRHPNPHARKFLQQPGRYVDDVDGDPSTADLHFWAEWEPQSKLIRAIEDPPPNYPKNIVRPYLKPRPDIECLHTTDPFVFGDRFYYSHCAMTRGMTRLAKGSVILFGSHKGGAFLLDTVLVVEDWIEYNRENYRSLRVPSIFFEATLEPLYSDRENCNRCPPGLRLYLGAMRSVPFEGMFSFFPCLPAGESNGFPRPEICHVDFIEPRLRQNKKITECNSIDDARALWQAVATQVLNTNVGGERLRLGVFAEMPERVQ